MFRATGIKERDISKLKNSFDGNFARSRSLINTPPAVTHRGLN